MGTLCRSKAGGAGKSSAQTQEFKGVASAHHNQCAEWEEVPHCCAHNLRLHKSRSAGTHNHKVHYNAAAGELS